MNMNRRGFLGTALGAMTLPYVTVASAENVVQSTQWTDVIAAMPKINGIDGAFLRTIPSSQSSDISKFAISITKFDDREVGGDLDAVMAKVDVINVEFAEAMSEDAAKQLLHREIWQASNDIAKKTRRGRAQYYVPIEGGILLYYANFYTNFELVDSGKFPVIDAPFARSSDGTLIVNERSHLYMKIVKFDQSRLGNGYVPDDPSLGLTDGLEYYANVRYIKEEITSGEA